MHGLFQFILQVTRASLAKILHIHGGAAQVY